MTIIIPQKYMDYYKRNPILNNKPALRQLNQNIRAGHVAIVDNETYSKIQTNNTADTGNL